MERTDLFTFTLTRYAEPMWGWRWMGKGRRALDLGKISFIFECWWVR